MNNTLIAKERKEFHHSTLTQLRSHGNIPSVVYGRHQQSKSIVVNNVDLLKVLKDVGRNGIISLDVEGNQHSVILADYQADPIKHEIQHADFLYIDKTTEVHAQVYVELKGTAKGVEDGGILQQSLHELNITAKPMDIPEAIEIDISALQLNHTINVGKIRESYSKITINHDDDEVIVTVLPSKQEPENSADEQPEGKVSDTEDKE